MPTTHLSLRSLHLLSPTLEEDFAAHMAACVADCVQRPSLNGKREVTIKFTITPHPEDQDDALVKVQSGRKVPTRVIDPIRARRSRRNQLQFDFEEESL